MRKIHFRKPKSNCVQLFHNFLNHLKFFFTTLRDHMKCFGFLAWMEVGWNMSECSSSEHLPFNLIISDDRWLLQWKMGPHMLCSCGICATSSGIEALKNTNTASSCSNKALPTTAPCLFKCDFWFLCLRKNESGVANRRRNSCWNKLLHLNELYALHYVISCISIKVPAASVTCDYLGCPSRFQPFSCIPTRCLLLKLGQRVTVDIWRGLSSGSLEDYIVLFPTGASSLMWMFCLPHREHEKHTVDSLFFWPLRDPAI